MVLRFFNGGVSFLGEWLERRMAFDILGISHKREAHPLATLQAMRENTAEYASNLLVDVAPIAVADAIDARPYDLIARFVKLIHGSRPQPCVSLSKLVFY